MKISFTPSDWYGPHGREHVVDDLRSVSRVDLGWYYFFGILHINHNGVEVGPPWEWTPLFDIMFSLQRVADLMRSGHEEEWIGFTENTENIHFKLSRVGVCVKPSYLEAVQIDCTIEDLVSAIHGFIRSEVERVVVEYPSLAENPSARELAASVDLALPD